MTANLLELRAVSRTRLVWLCLPLLLCTGFEWPGRLARLKYELSRGEEPERREAVRRLGAYPAADVGDALVAALEDDDAAVRKEAARAVARARVAEGAPLLGAFLADRDPELRAAAVRALGALAQPSSREALTRALSDAIPAVRSEAVVALAKVADDEALVELQTAAADPDPSVREAALVALRGRADGRALPALSGRIHDESPDVRAALMRTLGALRDARALPLLVRAAESESGEVELAAVMALGELGATTEVSAGSLLPSLKKKLAAEPRVAKAALASIGRIDGPAAVALLLDTLADPELALAAKSALVERVRARAGTPRATAEGLQLTTALEAVLSRSDNDAQIDVIADLITELGAALPSATLHPSLVGVLARGRGDPSRLSRALASTGAPEALVPLLERLSRLGSSTEQRPETPRAPLVDAPQPAATSGEPSGIDTDALLDAMLEYFAAGLADGRATDPLLAQLARADDIDTRIKLITLLGYTKAPRALPALAGELAHPDLGVRRASLTAIGRIGSPDSAPTLRPLLAAAQPELRTAAARAYGAVAREQDVVELLALLDGESAADRVAVLTSLGLALGRLRAAGQLSAQTDKLALSTLSRWLGIADARMSAHTLDALRRFGHPGAARAIARELLSPKLPRRAAATYALADFPGDETRRLLRFVLQRSAPRAGAAALLALGEVGDQRDVAALVRIARHAHWPLPAVATFALRRFAERADVKKRALERSLCELTDLADPYARANIVAGLAALGGSACPDLDLRAWYAAGEPSVVRSAVGRWLRAHALASADTGADPQLASLLARCAGDSDPLVRAACAVQPPAGVHALDIVAVDGGSEAPLRNRLVALRLPDASAFVGYTDANARVLLARVPNGVVTLENPGE